MSVLTPEEMKEYKRKLGYTNEMVAQKSGVPLGTVQKIFSGSTKRPRRETLIALSKVFQPDITESAGLSMLREPAAPYGSQSQSQGLGLHNGGRRLHAKQANESASATLSTGDYYALPDDRRAELIDGVIYDMASPSKLHQGVLQGIFVQLDHCMEYCRDTCFLYIAPSDVELGDDQNTVVQPDLYIHCNLEKELDAPHHGAPDFILEVLSPSNPEHDLWRKQELYRRYGVREYWIVDPNGCKVLVWDFENSLLPTSYTFEDSVPVTISGGKCSVDFRKVYARVRHLYKK